MYSVAAFVVVFLTLSGHVLGQVEMVPLILSAPVLEHSERALTGPLVTCTEELQEIGPGTILLITNETEVETPCQHALAMAKELDALSSSPCWDCNGDRYCHPCEDTNGDTFCNEEDCEVQCTSDCVNQAFMDDDNEFRKMWDREYLKGKWHNTDSYISTIPGDMIFFTYVFLGLLMIMMSVLPKRTREKEEEEIVVKEEIIVKEEEPIFSLCDG